ncbi:MAG: hypothetical protein GQ547_04835, partial [Methylophaga sp.]|nr:hypothetical protein [Methylophaga sp.]
MKNLVFVVLLVVVAIAGYSYMNQSKENVDTVAVEEMAVDTTEGNAVVTGEVTAIESEEMSMITPADMTEEAQAEMYNHIMEYNQCMMQNRLEYHQQGVRAENVADKTLTACEPHLDSLKATLTTNNVNEGLREGMVKTMRQR